MAETTDYSVLVVDDSPEQIRYISEILKPEGCRIYATTSSKAALKILKQNLPDLIILDIIMPGMDGFEFCRILKADKETMDIPVIFATAYHDADYIGKGFEAGACDYVVKPFIREELLERVKVRIRLTQKRIEIQRAYDELDKFCYTVSHDIKSPLHVIRQLSGLLEHEMSRGNWEEAGKICEMLKDKAEQAANMTDGLHQFSKAFYSNIKRTEVNMEELLQNVFGELSMLEAERELEFDMETLPSAQGDPVLMRLVIQNVLGNALKFTRNRKVAKIAVRGEKSKGKLVYTVTDNGIGFEETYSQELFQLFRKLHTQGEYEGDGIGLATVKRIMFRHGGNAEVESKPGQGTSIRLILPTEYQ